MRGRRRVGAGEPEDVGEGVVWAGVVVVSAGSAELLVGGDSGFDNGPAGDHGTADRDPPLAVPVGDAAGGVLELREAVDEPVPSLVGGRADLLDAEADRVEGHLRPGLAGIADVAGIVAVGVVSDMRGDLG